MNAEEKPPYRVPGMAPEGAPPVRGDDDLLGQPLSVLLFACSEHGEELTVEYYDPDDPPLCSHGDLMSRKSW